MLPADLLPGTDHRTRHERVTTAEPAACGRALGEVVVGDTRLTLLLFTLRTLPAVVVTRSRQELRGLRRTRVLDAFVRAGLSVVHADEGAVVYAGIAKFWRPTAPTVPVADAEGFRAFAEPGWIKVAFALGCAPEAAGTRLWTETRIKATDPGSLRRFRPYWAVIHPFSDLIRRDILRAVARRASR